MDRTPRGRLQIFQLMRLERALAARRGAGDRMAERMADHAIGSFLRSCDEAGIGDVAARLVRGHRARMGR